MPVYKKRSESTLVGQTIRHLYFLQSVGKVAWHSRLQSGCVKVVKGYKGKKFEHFMNLCPKGTPDVMVIMNNGHVLWIELKTKTGKVRTEQEEFKVMTISLSGHSHMYVRDIQELEKFLEKESNDNNT